MTSDNQPSFRKYTGELAPIEYPSEDHIRKVNKDGLISLDGNLYLVGGAFAGYHVGIRPAEKDGKFRIFFCHQQVAKIDLNLN